MDRDVTADPEALVELRDVIGRMATPTIVLGDEVLLGFASNRARIEALLRTPPESSAPMPQSQETESQRRERAEMDQEIAGLLRSAKTIAVVGLSGNPDRPSYGVAKYLQEQGYRIIPVNPTIDRVLGEKSYPDLASVPGKVDIVDIFRRPEHVPAIVEAAIARGIPAVWMQLGIVNEGAAQLARSAGLTVVMDRCLQLEHFRFEQEGAL